MKLGIFAVRDAKMAAYMTPFFFKTNGQAVRAFVDEVNREGSDFGRHAEDFGLFRIGEYDEETADLKCELQPVPLMQAANALELNSEVAALRAVK